MADKNTQQFLDEEAAASKLVEELKQLRQETESYSASRGALDEVGAKLAALVARTEDLVLATNDTITTLGEIGTAQLLDGQRELREELRSLMQQTALTRNWLAAVAALLVVLVVVGIIATVAA